jgi:hypothetical protein
MKSIIKKWKRMYGYEPKLSEVYSHYTQGYLILTDQEENELISKIQIN